MGGGHAHVAGDVSVQVGRAPRLALLTLLALTAVATLWGIWQLWPDAADAPEAASYAAPGVTMPYAEVVAVQPACPVVDRGSPGEPPDAGFEPSPDCGHIEVRVDAPAGRETVQVDVPPEVSAGGLRPGDRVQLVRLPGADGQPASYAFQGVDRHVSLFWMAGAFALLVVAVARLRGLMALVTLVFSGWMLLQFMLPALLAGQPATWVALAGCSAIMFVVLYATHGPSIRTSAALAGTLIGLAITAVIGSRAVEDSRLTGVADETGGLLSVYATGLEFPGLLVCGVILAGLGVLNDVTITQASAVWELRSAAPEATRRRVFTGAMRIGRDHIASTIYTITFAYAGASLVLLLLLSLYDRPMLDLLSSEDIAEEVVRTLASGIGLVLAVPITTAIAAATASPFRPPTPRGWEPDTEPDPLAAVATERGRR